MVFVRARDIYVTGCLIHALVWSCISTMDVNTCFLERNLIDALGARFNYDWAQKQRLDRHSKIRQSLSKIMHE